MNTEEVSQSSGDKDKRTLRAEEIILERLVNAPPTKTHAPLSEKFLPVVSKVTDRIGLAKQYNALAAQVQQTGLVKISDDQARVERHVTSKALDGLYLMIGEEEKKLRENPAGAATDLLRRVFGSLKT